MYEIHRHHEPCELPDRPNAFESRTEAEDYVDALIERQMQNPQLRRFARGLRDGWAVVDPEHPEPVQAAEEPEPPPHVEPPAPPHEDTPAPPDAPPAEPPPDAPAT